MTAQASPWARQDVVRWAVTVLLGAAISGLAWWLAADRVEFSEQMPYASVGVAGLLLGAYGHLAWLLRGRRSVGLRRLSLLGEPAVRPVADAPAGRARTPAFLAVEGRARYHRSGCPLLEGRVTVSATIAAHRAAARRPCGVCDPAADERP